MESVTKFMSPSIRKEIFIMNNELKSILSRVDHTLLAQSATWNEIKAICDDGIRYAAPACASPPPM